ncbi:DUF2946 domain-containing protein [Pandoraea apista]|uniref:DUF2946 domain-containing protein n=1 Tax=Pandoraea apista TaxID=93218 RepID=UPI00065A4A85|nr:DUF2946 domain-containing protein [Pandoraea apista]ALS64268.1 hypothetical protein AT395_03980 [Pandoraea apista]RRW99541.1 DUF2946 domain-containing protein [Pandoraea apista]RRX07856.1 DUF2946 domain-containing protein [Pandoraea apista]CFB63896.1 hypothetical protein LMG16407_03982 [Pandoraea apista]
MSFTARKRLFAWLGLAAMWLAICMPAISQVLAAHRAEQARILDVAFCTVDGIAPAMALTLSADAHGGQAAHDTSLSHSSHDSQGDVCGYCSLLANHPPLAMPALTGAVSFAWIARAGPVADSRPTNAPLALTPPARAPPAVS